MLAAAATLAAVDVLRNRFRLCEWVLLAYYGYVAASATAFGLGAGVVARAWLVPAAAALLFLLLSTAALQPARDWVVLGLVLLAYREMDWFSHTYKARRLEQLWLGWDHRYLFDRGFREWIEAAGAPLPAVLELSYLLVYGIGVFLLAALYVAKRQDRANAYLTTYLVGTLLAYAMFPYFPSDPPRVLFPGMDLPNVVTAMRRLNLWLVGGYGIHSSVFPSAHVSSAFSAAWGVVRFLPERKWVGRVAVIYAATVSVATVYGRYHYAADAVAGFAVSLVALAASYAIGGSPRARRFGR